MRKVLAFRLSALVLLVGVCSLSALGNESFSMTVRDVVIDGTALIIAEVDPGVMPIPEPTSLLLFGSGVGVLFGKKIRRRFKKGSPTA